MCKLLILDTAALALGFILDFFIGDPHALPHPVVGIGRLISACEKKLRRGGRGDICRGAVTLHASAGPCADPVLEDQSDPLPGP